jgi:hypothetical protein
MIPNGWSAMFDSDRLVREDATAKAKGKIVGRYIQRPYGDGYAVYKIRAATTKATIEWVDIGDGLVHPEWGKWKVIALSEVKLYLQQRDAVATLIKQSRSQDDWWAQQTIGAIVHYNNKNNQFVRGVIVQQHGEKMMLPTALVGAWWRFDCWRRSADGTVQYQHYARQIIEHRMIQPNAVAMVENPAHYLRGIDPRIMEPIAFMPPAITPEQAKLAAITQTYEAIVTALKHEHSADPVVLARAMQAAVKRVKQLLAGWQSL